VFITKTRGKHNNNNKKITDLQSQNCAVKGDSENLSFPGGKRQAYLLKYSSCQCLQLFGELLWLEEKHRIQVSDGDRVTPKTWRAPVPTERIWEYSVSMG